MFTNVYPSYLPLTQLIPHHFAKELIIPKKEQHRGFVSRKVRQ